MTEPGLYTVGNYDHSGNWSPESDHNSRSEASDRVAYLNGATVIEKPIGLTKRDQFAIMALQGILSNPANNSNDLMGVNGNISTGFIQNSLAVQQAVLYSDSLIAELNKEKS